MPRPTKKTNRRRKRAVVDKFRASEFGKASAAYRKLKDRTDLTKEQKKKIQRMLAKGRPNLGPSALRGPAPTPPRPDGKMSGDCCEVLAPWEGESEFDGGGSMGAMKKLYTERNASCPPPIFGPNPERVATARERHEATAERLGGMGNLGAKWNRAVPFSQAEVRPFDELRAELLARRDAILADARSLKPAKDRVGSGTVAMDFSSPGEDLPW